MGIIIQSCTETPSPYILLTYRSSIIPCLSTNKYSSDAGWGCMLRVSQMFIANYLHLYLNQPLDLVLPKFLDNQSTHYSIQRFTQYGVKQFQKKQQDWYTPAQGAFLIKQFLQKEEQTVRVNICSDNCLFWNTIQLDKQEIILFLMLRIGLNQPQPQYLKVITRLSKNKFFQGILGGRPKYAHYFFQISNNDKSFLYLDPHKTKSAIKNSEDLQQRKSQFIGYPKQMLIKDIDPSLCIGFKFKKHEFQQFKKSVQQLKTQLKQQFLIFIAQQMPQYDQNDIIEIIDDE